MGEGAVSLARVQADAEKAGAPQHGNFKTAAYARFSDTVDPPTVLALVEALRLLRSTVEEFGEDGGPQGLAATTLREVDALVSFSPTHDPEVNP